VGPDRVARPQRKRAQKIPGTRSLWGPVALAALLVACASVLPVGPPSPSPSPSDTSPGLTPTAGPSPTATPTPWPGPTPTPSDLYLTPGDIAFYPGPELYSGDIVTFDVTPQNLGEINPYAITVRVSRQTLGRNEPIIEGTVGYPTLDDVPRARLAWVWDTTGLGPRESILVQLDPDDRIQAGDELRLNNGAAMQIALLPAGDRPPSETAAAWATAMVECCRLHCLTGTAAERDLPAIATTVEAAVERVQESLDVHLYERLDVYLIDRVIGHGGYAYQGLVISYLDRSYAGHDVETVLRHEATHLLDTQLIGAWPPTMLREGLAVHLSGGHIRPEVIPQRAAALLSLGWYTPLDQLANGFYLHQHETSYVEAAAFVTYLIETHGWEQFLGFYSSFPPNYEDDSEALNTALREAFDVGLPEAEEAFRRWLERNSPTPDQVRKLELTVHLFDTIRRYQQIFDPSAHFLTGRLPDPAEGERRGIVADFMRRPRAVENVTLETMLVAAHEALAAASYARVEELLDEANQVLATGDFTGRLAADYLAIVNAVTADGYEVQRIEMSRTGARVWAVADSPDLIELTLEHTSAGWALR
jgi:hypothetical protein